METITLNFKASGQTLTADANPQRYASNTVNYIQAVFDLDDNWKSFDSVRAVWHNDFACISMVLDGSGACAVPHEVLSNLDEVQVNLVGSVVDGDELTDRMTTYPLQVAVIDADALICGTETAEVTPSQFEQFIAQVAELVGSVRDIDRIELNEDYTLTVYYSDGTSWTSTSIRGEQGETGNGIASAVLNDDYTLTLTFTDGTSYTTSSIRGEQGPQGEPGEVTLAQLESVLPTDTASGAIASFPDGSDLFDYLSCICDINPVQDLHGYDKPWVGGAGKNLFNKDTITDNTWINDQGVAQPVSGFWLSDYIPISAETTYFRPDTGSGRNAFYASDKSFVSYVLAANQSITSPQNAAYIRIVGTGTTYTTAQFEEGSTATSYAPYENICPITGWVGCDITQLGVNWYGGISTVLNGYIPSSGVITAENSNRTVICEVLPSTKYTISFTRTAITGADDWQVAEYETTPQIGSTGTRVIAQSTTTPTATITTGASTHYLAIKLANVNNTNFDATKATLQVELGQTASAYSAYNGTVYPITWQTEAGTVYGGTVDVVTGVLTAYPYYTSYNGETLVGPWVSSMDEYIEGRIPTTGAQVVDLGGTPTTYQLTPTQIHALLGQNNVWADCGDVEVQYKADVQRWVEKMLNA